MSARDPMKNTLLQGFPPGVADRLVPHLSRLTLRTGDVVHHPGERVRHVLFPESGVISVINVLTEGRSMEVGTIGREGMTGAPALFGGDVVPYRHVVQVPGIALRISLTTMLASTGSDVNLSQVIVRYYVAFTSQIMQSVACAGLHSVEQRCCRWLLATHDRVDSDQFSLTHEYLAAMLGIRRTSVSQILKIVRNRGFIDYRRGAITILNRPGLESRACECYRVIAGIFRQLHTERHPRRNGHAFPAVLHVPSR
jgi:CRP-like cAMP-binding protein